MELEKFSEFVYGISHAFALNDPHRPEKSCLSQHPSKTSQRGLVWERGVFPYPSGENRTQAHTGGAAGAIRLCWQLVFGISSFSGPIPKVLFFVYAAQFLYRRLHPSPPLIMFYRTLLGDMENLSFPFHRCDRMRFLKLPQNWPKPVLLWVRVLFPHP